MSATAHEKYKMVKSLKSEIVKRAGFIVGDEEGDIDFDFDIRKKNENVPNLPPLASTLGYVTRFPSMLDHKYHPQGLTAGLIEPLFPLSIILLGKVFLKKIQDWRGRGINKNEPQPPHFPRI